MKTTRLWGCLRAAAAKGKELTRDEIMEIAQLHAKIAEAERKVIEAEQKANPG